MPTIQLLDQNLINKIAAGEVVERPASVVKELIENSLDAGASSIVVEIENGGLDLIRIVDDGIGMNEIDAKMSLQRHATSKIRTIDDLQNISTLGFRGEALAAISSVSQFRIVTRQDGEVGAVEATCVDREIVIGQAAGAKGTVVEVRGLFHNIPARKKFLKSANTEFRYITEVFTHQALLTPQVGWKLMHNGKVVADYPIVNDWKARVVAMLGKDMSENLIELHHQGRVTIDGFLAHPALARERSQQQYIFVNKRPVKDFVLSKAVKEGFSHHIAHGLQPSFVIQISIAPDLVDVNVHPRKTEVKFADPGSVFRELVHAVRNALGDIAGDPFKASPESFRYSKPSTKYELRPSATQVKQSFGFQRRVAQRPDREVSRTGRLPVSMSAALEWKLLGQVNRSFLIVEAEDGLMIVDQHAVAEKVLYEKLLSHIEAPKVQSLLVPAVVELSLQQMVVVINNDAVLKQCGIEGEEFGGNSYRLTGVPQDLNVKDIKKFIFELIEDISDEEFLKLPSLEERQRKMLKYAACRGAIKFNDPLTHEEQIQLLSDMKEYNIVSCCHGRPVMMKIGWGELGKKFHR